MAMGLNPQPANAMSDPAPKPSISFVQVPTKAEADKIIRDNSTGNVIPPAPLEPWDEYHKSWLGNGPKYWHELSPFKKFMAIFIIALTVGGVAFVFGYGRIWFRKDPA